MKFKVGERVKGYMGVGRIIVIDNASIGVEHDDNIKGHTCEGNGKKEYCLWYNLSGNQLQKIGGSMSKHAELTQRINGLSNGWDKEADDILTEIQLKSNRFDIVFRNYCYGADKVNSGRIWIMNDASLGNSEKLFNECYNSQCEKMEVFKKALLYALNHSDIKKDLVGQKVTLEFEGKKVKARILEEI